MGSRQEKSEVPPLDSTAFRPEKRERGRWVGALSSEELMNHLCVYYESPFLNHLFGDSALQLAFGGNTTSATEQCIDAKQENKNGRKQERRRSRMDRMGCKQNNGSAAPGLHGIQAREI